jgi:DNA end-binding protein Ku
MFGFSVKVYKATNDAAEGVSFRQLHSACGHSINQVKRCNHCATDVQMVDLVKGYEVSPNNFLTFSDDEIKALRPERLGVVKVDGYMADDEIQDGYFDGTVYFLAPDGKDHTTFVTFRQALGERWAVGKVVMYGRERVVAIRPVDRLLAMHFIRTHSELRSAADVPGFDKVPETANDEYAALMAQVMDAKTIRFDEVVLESDSYADAVRALIESRKAGLPAPAQPEAAPLGKATDLMAMLKASLAAAQSQPVQ